ncbi:proteoglycan 4 isoform X2 [Zerene cesonia]|uniref:proteoglycan 4 isoform X2 n=1 Tax=Zerene cesonia TaxID=33412 RepID=UPI0018E518A0|nr:proteoglycan 4 isoform X2 [Zerene cesonia]
MSQKVTRKGPIAEDKEKRHADSPVKDMKKKVAANAEKEKQIAEKEKTADKASANDKQTEKATAKTEKNVKKDEAKEKVDKKDKPAEKIAEKAPEKRADNVEKKEKSVEKVADKKDKPTEKKEAVVAPTEKPKEESKENGKAEASDKGKKEPPAKAAKQNGARLNGDAAEGTVSSDDDDDGLFPELAYEDSDMECFEPPTPDGPSRSYTRRSQVKASRTPETPRPASDKQADKDYVPDDPKESKLLKLKDDAPSDRKLRSSDSPKPQERKEKGDAGKARETETGDANDTRPDEKLDMEVTVEVETEDAEARKAGTNYSRSRVRVSPYRRARPPADTTQSSTLANYPGNNTTMEMDVTETSIVSEELPAAESPYLSGLRSIRGRRSYKRLGDVRAASPLRPNTSEQSSRPTGTVVGRKRKPEPPGPGAGPAEGAGPGSHGGPGEGTKRARLLERLGGLARPFRFSAERVCVESTAEIVGINTDLPLTAPVATADPEAMKHVTSTPIQSRVTQQPRDKRCSIM